MKQPVTGFTPKSYSLRAISFSVVSIWNGPGTRYIQSSSRGLSKMLANQPLRMDCKMEKENIKRGTQKKEKSNAACLFPREDLKNKSTE